MDMSSHEVAFRVPTIQFIIKSITPGCIDSGSGFWVCLQGLPSRACLCPSCSSRPSHCRHLARWQDQWHEGRLLPLLVPLRMQAPPALPRRGPSR